MVVFIRKSIIFLFSVIILFALGAICASKFVERNEFSNYETESNLLMLKENEKYDIGFMGISHARNFSRHNNHLRVERILNKKILNLGQGGGVCGVNEQFFYLKYFYSKGITIDTIVYVLSPPLLFGNHLNKATNTFKLEPLRFDFFVQYLRFPAKNKYLRLFEYVRSKYQLNWLNLKPYSLDRKTDQLDHYDQKKVEEGLKVAYPYFEQNDLSSQNANFDIVEQTVKWSKAQGTTVIFIIPPAIFGKWKKHQRSIDFCELMKKKYNCEYYDFSESIYQLKYYYDHHHLNSEGVEYFTRNYLLPILK